MLPIADDHHEAGSGARFRGGRKNGLARLALVIAAAWVVGFAGIFGARQFSKRFLANRDAARATMRASLLDLARDGDRDATRRGLLKAITQDPSFPEPYYNYALLSEADEDWGTAIEWFQKFIALDKTSSQSLLAKSELERLPAVKRLDATPSGQQLRAYDDAIARAKLLFRAGFPKQAAAEAHQAALIDPTRWEAYAVAAAALVKSELYNDAAKFLQAARSRALSTEQAQLDGLMTECRNRAAGASLAEKANSAFRSADYKKAAALFSKAWEAVPSEGQYGMGAAVSLAQQRKYDAAQAILNKLTSSADPAIAKRARVVLANIKSTAATANAD